MKQINYKSDFDFILRLKDGRGNAIGWPDYDWEARFWTTSKVNEFVASCKGGVCVNCYNDNGEIHVVANDHKLSAGVLNVEFTAEIPNGVYPDDSERIVIPLPLEIELIRAAAPCPEGFEVEVQLPYIWESAFDLAHANGYTGSREEYNSALAEMPESVRKVKEALAKLEQEGGAGGQRPVKVIGYDEPTGTLYI